MNIEVSHEVKNQHALAKRTSQIMNKSNTECSSIRPTYIFSA